MYIYICIYKHIQDIRVTILHITTIHSNLHNMYIVLITSVYYVSTHIRTYMYVRTYVHKHENMIGTYSVNL